MFLQAFARLPQKLKSTFFENNFSQLTLAFMAARSIPKKVDFIPLKQIVQLPKIALFYDFSQLCKQSTSLLKSGKENGKSYIIIKMIKILVYHCPHAEQINIKPRFKTRTEMPEYILIVLLPTFCWVKKYFGLAINCKI